MPRSPTLKTYDRLFLEKLSRAQIQMHAKRNNIKANGKTESIIALLLGKEILAEEVPVSTVGRSTRAGARRNHTNAINAEGAGTAERGSRTASVKINPAPSPSVLRGEPTLDTSAPQTRATKKARRRGTPYPLHISGSESSLDSSGGESTYPPAPTFQAQSEIVPMGQTDSDVRVVRRRLTELGNQQVYLQRELDDINTLLKYSHQDMMSSAKRIDHLSWVRQAVEEVVMLDLKDDRHIWDGTGRMDEKNMEAWRQFVRENGTGPPRWQPTVSTDYVGVSEAIAAYLEELDAENAENAEQEVLQNDDRLNTTLADEKDDEEDSIYV